MVKAITRKGKNKTEALKTIKNIPQKLPINVDIQLRGELYGHRLTNTKSQALAEKISANIQVRRNNIIRQK